MINIQQYGIDTYEQTNIDQDTGEQFHLVHIYKFDKKDFAIERRTLYVNGEYRAICRAFRKMSAANIRTIIRRTKNYQKLWIKEETTYVIDGLNKISNRKEIAI